LTLFVHAEERYCIEVLSTKDKKAIDKEFMDKVGTIQIPHFLKYRKGEYKVFLGDFKTREDAEAILPEVREKINKDAFVSVAKEEKKTLELNANAKMQQAMLMAQAKMITKPPLTQTEEMTAEKEDAVVKPVDISGPQENIEVTVKEGQTEKALEKKVKKQEEKTKKAPHKRFCKPTKKALREEEIAEALTFYRNSSFYTFKN
jgi:hypothetical protein